MARSTKTVALNLSKLAQEQGGYFTTQQAAAVGYGYRHLDYHETARIFSVSHTASTGFPVSRRVNTTNSSGSRSGVVTRKTNRKR